MITLSDIMGVDMQTLGTIPDAELEGALAKGKQILLARQRAQKAAGIKAPIWKDFSPYKLKTKGLSRTEMENQFKAIQQKLGAQTTTIKGYNQWVNRQAAAMGRRKRGREAGNEKYFSQSEIKKAWAVFEKFKELHPSIVDKWGSEKSIKEVYKLLNANPKVAKFDKNGKVIVDIDVLQDEMKARYEFLTDADYTEEQWNNM